MQNRTLYTDQIHHPATGITPYEAMRGATVRIKLDHIQPKVQGSEKDAIKDERNAAYKQKMKQNRGQKHRKTSAG